MNAPNNSALKHTMELSRRGPKTRKTNVLQSVRLGEFPLTQPFVLFMSSVDYSDHPGGSSEIPGIFNGGRERQ